ncbi:RHS repeat-associated protein [Chitinophaga niastensis]|uniref:RHS repeat-associated protein n=1 Tax=Chitinophaga niastensis TaxID=536980 RepID=A0A2P8HAQ8_CHINA|nr:RHS repeat-associated protein [Chitinophaga niastensis]
MAGISSNALKGSNYPENRMKYNGNELQNKEFSDGSGLEWFDFNARTYDQQLGRFIQIDPLIESGERETLSPYHFAKNNPVKYNDPDGKCPNCLVGGVVGFFVDAAVQVSASVVGSVARGEPVSLGTISRDFSVTQSLAATAAGAITSGLSAVEEAGVSLTVKTVAVNGSVKRLEATGSKWVSESY